MSYESTAEPIKVGYLMDFTLPPGFPEEMKADFTQCFDIVFDEAVQQGLLDRPVQMIYREVEGLPKGSVKAVIDAFGELVDEGCLAVFGPHITDNCVPHAATSVACPWPYPEAKVYDPQGFYEKAGAQGPYSVGIWSTWASGEPNGRPHADPPPPGQGACASKNG